MTFDKLLRISRLLAILVIMLVLLIPGAYSFGIRTGKKQASDWDVTKVHRSLQIDGYNYCPYCGEQIKH